jgi:phosphoribosylformylglycinamidine (FGAM) synthase PurS component
MKNIHLLPTEKPSRLFKFANELHLDTIPKDYYKKYNIYLTSDEEIKEGEKGWLLENNSITKNVCEFDCSNGLGGIYPTDKKIILTTDQDLIANGVQAIDDEFLEWFVKNPSCEKVDVELKDGWCLEEAKTIPNSFYKIIIPKEEPKQETLEEAAERLIINPTLEDKQVFKEGAKWQAKSMYSEEEVRELLLMQRGNSYVAILTKTKDEELAAIASTAPEPCGKDGWVKQFKKK